MSQSQETESIIQFGDDRLPSEYWAKVLVMDSGCWEWTGSRRPPRWYGAFYFRGGADSAHRYCYKAVRGPIAAGMYICHHCDNPPCVNPAHLYMGTPTDNARDMFRRARTPVAKIHAEQAAEIRRLRGTGMQLLAIAARMGYSTRARSTFSHQSTSVGPSSKSDSSASTLTPGIASTSRLASRRT